MCLQRVGAVGMARHVVAVRIAVAERHVHHRAGQRAVGAGPRRQVQVRHRGRRRAVRIDHHQLRPAFLPGARDVVHHVDLGGDRVAAPHHDQVGQRHLARVGAAALADAGDPAVFRQRGADRQLLPRIAHHVAQPVDAVALHQAHRAGVVVRPDRGRAVPCGDVGEGVGDAVQRLVPGDLPELPGAFRPGAQQRMRQAVRVMDALGVARHLGADDAGRVAVFARAAHRADARVAQHLHLQRAGGGAVVRADRGADFSARAGGGSIWHRGLLPIGQPNAWSEAVKPSAAAIRSRQFNR